MFRSPSGLDPIIMGTVLLLLIEDDHALAQQVREQLEQNGHRVR